MAASKSIVVKVHFMNTSSKAFAMDPNATAHALRDMVIERLGLKQHHCFDLFVKGEDVVRCLDSNEKPFDLMNKWDKTGKAKEEFNHCFVFKKKIFLKDDDKELEDPVALDLVYQQAVHDITNSICPAAHSATKLAGYQMQVTYGDHNANIHVPGFLTKSVQTNLKSFVPIDLYKSKKGDLEATILKEHMQHVGMAREDAKRKYLGIVKGFPLYGTTFFPPCRSILNRNLGKVIIGVNYEGIRLLKPKTKETISEHLFTEILNWASSAGTFGFEFGNASEMTKYSFETKQGSIIAGTIQTYIDILVQMLKQGEDDEDSSYTSDKSQAI